MQSSLILDSLAQYLYNPARTVSKFGVDDMTAKKGDKVKVDYVGTLDDGTVFDDSQKHGTPLEFEVGSGNVIKGFDEAVVGMKVGQERKVRIEPKDAYGDYNPKLIKEVPKERLPDFDKLKIGMMLAMHTNNGLQIPAKITKMDKESVTIDLNPPMAGKTLNFKIKLVDIGKKE